MTPSVRLSPNYYSSDATIRPVSASTPRCSLRQARRLRVPCFSTSHSPRAAQLQARAVHQQVHGLRAGPWSWDLQGLGPAAQGGMVGNRESETKQANDRTDQAFGLAQSQAEHGLERQGRQDGELGIPGLPAAGGARLRPPGRDRLLREPDRQAPTLAQGRIILGPVRDPAPLLRDMMAASSIGLERHRGSRVTEGVVHLRQPSQDANRPIRATNSPFGTYAFAAPALDGVVEAKNHWPL